MRATDGLPRLWHDESAQPASFHLRSFSQARISPALQPRHLPQNRCLRLSSRAVWTRHDDRFDRLASHTRPRFATTQNTRGRFLAALVRVPHRSVYEALPRLFRE